MNLFSLVTHYDHKWFSRLNAIADDGWWISYNRIVSTSADGYFYIAVAALIWLQGGWQHGLLPLLICFLIERLIYFVLKNVFRRDRPAVARDDFHSAIVPSDKFSFPSGHTSAAFMVAIFLAHYFPLLIAPLLVWAVLVAVARVALGVHFPTDVMVGAALGSSVALSVLSLVVT